jgi:hypothetical protein
VIGHRVTLRAALVAVALVVASPAWADDPAFVTGSVGRYDMFDNEKAVAFNLEYRFAEKFLIFKPIAGIMGTTDRAAYGYGGIRVDLFLGRRLVLTPSFAAGLYADGDGKELGHTIEFRSGAELAWRFDNRARVGAGFYHISNAGLGKSNPGTEILSLVFSWPLGPGN